MDKDRPPDFGTLFPFITQYTPVIPKLYWDVYSAEQRMKWLCMEWDRIEHYMLDLCNQTNRNSEVIDALQRQFEEFKEHGFDDYYREMLERWILEHFADILTEGIRSVVFFGLTSDGYFVAYRPESWNEIIFDTGAVYGTSEYGRLLLYYPSAHPEDEDTHPTEQPDIPTGDPSETETESENTEN
jgi:hypothetical protein